MCLHSVFNFDVKIRLNFSFFLFFFMKSSCFMVCRLKKIWKQDLVSWWWRDNKSSKLVIFSGHWNFFMAIWFELFKWRCLSSIIDTEISNIPNVRLYSYKELRKATENFRSENKLGQGGFGSVYKVQLKQLLVVSCW